MKELDRFHWNEEELLTYEQAEKYEGAYLASMAQKYDEGLAEVLERGRQERDIEMARTLLLKEVDIELIVETTMLSKEEIAKLSSSGPFSSP